jgi:DNA-binding transcriptional LysR family regulator
MDTIDGLSVHALVRRIDLFTLKLFLSTVEEGQIGRAAVREHIVASAATKRIQDLEELAGLRLLDRNPKGVVPSAAGRRYIVDQRAHMFQRSSDGRTQTRLVSRHEPQLRAQVEDAIERFACVACGRFAGR